MKETGKNKDEGKRKKYNLTQNVEKEAPYRQMINPAIVDALYERILSILIVGKKYRLRDQYPLLIGCSESPVWMQLFESGQPVSDS